jgi:adenine-specific DNA-methyltransferase
MAGRCTLRRGNLEQANACDKNYLGRVLPHAGTGLDRKEGGGEPPSRGALPAAPWRELNAELCSNEEVQSELRRWFASLPRSHPSKALSRYKWVDDRGPWRDRDISWPGGDGPRYDVLHPVTGKPCKIPDDGWRFSTSEAMREQIASGLVQFREDEKQPPFRKAHLVSDDEDDEGSLSVMPSVIHRQAQVAVKLLKKIFDGKKVFENPKDHEVIARIIQYVADENAIVLDSFAGSGATGHAVLEANKADGGSRRFVLVEMDREIASMITGERILRVVSGHAGSTPLGFGFRFCTLGEPLFDADGNVSPAVAYPDLAAHVFFCDTGSPIPRRAGGPLIGTFQGRAIYLLFAPSSMGFPSPKAGNVLTAAVLDALPLPEPGFTGPRVVYAEGCTVPEDRLAAAGVTFRQVPYQIEGL